MAVKVAPSASAGKAKQRREALIDLNDINDLQDEESGEDDASDRLRDTSEAEFHQRAPGEEMPFGRNVLDITTDAGVHIVLNQCVELEDGSFLLVKEIVQGEGQVAYLMGVRLIRAKDVMNMLPMQRNEVCAMLNARGDIDGIPNIDSCLVAQPLSNVVCARALICTNQPFPAHSFRETDEVYETPEKVEDTGVLVCRWKHIEFCDTVTWKVPSAALVRLRRHECDVGVNDAQLLLEFQKDEEKRPGSAAGEPAADATTRYTFGDICAGAGGATTAAQLAGFAVKFALDFDEDACATLRQNFPDATICEEEIYDFCVRDDNNDLARVHALHLSFPCQPYSIAHVREGRNDARNMDTGFSVIPLFKKCRPRIATFEQSPNITKPKHEKSFQALIHQLTAAGYSAWWKVVDFAHTGNAQSRNRLFITASCPGQVLPQFPQRTHGPLLLPPTTVNDILRQLPSHIEPEMTQTVERRGGYADLMPHNGDRPLQGAITCNGGVKNLHPNGQRAFNLQELSGLQGFLASHVFRGGKTSILKQIGNAVPGKAARPYFAKVKEALEVSDAEVAAHDSEVIEID